MISIEIHDRKGFTNRLFLSDYFDSFLLSEAIFVTFGTFHIDGRLNRAYFSTEELDDPALSGRKYGAWKTFRPFCLSLIRGSHTPVEFRMVFRLSDGDTAKLLKESGLSYTLTDIGGLFLNLHFKEGALTCTTGSALNVFTLDKTLDHAWDDFVQKRLAVFS